MKQKQWIAFLGMVAVALILGACGGDSSTGGVGGGGSDGTLTDARDGQIYKTVVIGTQMWMAENLNYAVDSSWCYNNSADSCAKYGRLYQWASAMGLSATYNSTAASGVISTPQQGVCPVGWHIPTDAEWTILENAVGGYRTAGTVLKSTSGWSSNGNGTDTYGFSALPAGSRNDYGFDEVGDFEGFWNATENDTEDGTEDAYYRGLRYDDTDLYPGNSRKLIAFSVRCLKDAE